MPRKGHSPEQVLLLPNLMT